MRASYSRAIEWIAGNDEPTCFDIEDVSELISVQLVADNWGYSATKVAEDVVRLRQRWERTEEATVQRLPTIAT